MNENRMEIIKALSIRGAYLRMAKKCISNASSIILKDDVRGRFWSIYDELSEIIKQNDEQLRFWSSDDAGEEES